MPTIITLATFTGANGANPTSGLVEDTSGNLFGTTSEGGTSDDGTVFEVQKGSGTVTTLATFAGTNGATPWGSLIEDASGNLFGTTLNDGTSSDGTVFEVQNGSGTITTLAFFKGTNGAKPYAGVIEDSSGNLFGTTSQGGASGDGTVFEVQNGSGIITTLASFNGTNGATPYAGVIEDSSGNLFGTTGQGGAYDGGTVFEVKEGTGNVTTLATFNSAQGAHRPSGNLVEDSSRNLFGATLGTPGAVFEVQQGSNTATILTNFTGSNGENPWGGVIEDSSDNLFGTTADGGPSYNPPLTLGYGTVFELQKNTGSLISLGTFNGSNGAHPMSGLVEDSTGYLFGTTYGGGASFDGTVFEVPVFLTISTASLANWTLNQPGYSQTISVTAGTAPYMFALGSGSLPTGLTLTSGGILSGIPTAGGTFSFTIIATDSLGATSSQSYMITINPAVTLTTATLPNWTMNQPYGQTINATGGTPPGSYTFSQTLGTLPPGLVLSSAGVLSGTPATTGSYTFTVKATDSVGASGSRSYTIKINPAVMITTSTLANGDLNTAYDQTITATGGTGTITFTNSPPPSGLTLSLAGVLSGTPAAVGAVNFTVTAKDNVGNSDTKTYTLVINPAVEITTVGLANGVPGMAYIQSISTSGGTGLVTFAAPAASLPPGLTLSSGGVLSGTPTTAGKYTFTVVATDAIGGSASHSYSMIVGPGPFSQYLVTVLGPSTVQAGTSFQVTVQAADMYGEKVTSYSGPATVTASINPASTSSNFPMNVPLNDSGFGFFIANLQQVGTYTISVTDTSHTYTGSAPAVTVIAGPPAKLGFATQPVNTPTGDTLPTVTVDVLDAYGNVVIGDNTDSVTIGVGSGPGPFATGSTLTASVKNGVATFNNLALIEPGVYQLSALDPGLYTGPLSSAFIIVPLQVIPGSFVGSPSGFSLQFNARFLVNSATPVLYGQGFATTAPVPSVTLIGPSGPVEGSLVLDTTSNTITFVATNTVSMVNNSEPILPAGTYTAVVHASAADNGFQALNSGGGFLDGLGTGIAGSGDFTAKFVVNVTTMNTAVLWVPATADGPGQALTAPGANQIGGGYPLYLTDGRGVTSVTVTLNYNPALLNVTGATGSGFMLSTSSTPGHAVMQYSGPALAPSPALHPIPVTVGFLMATVPGGTAANPTPYKAKDLLHLSAASLNGGAIPAATDDGLHLVAYPGDANGDGAYSGDDALKITRVVLQTDNGFTAYPLVDPVIVADTDGSGFIPADAALQANEAGVGVPTANLPIPPIPSGVVFQATTATKTVPALAIEAALAAPKHSKQLSPMLTWFLPLRHRPWGQFDMAAALDQCFAASES